MDERHSTSWGNPSKSRRVLSNIATIPVVVVMLLVAVVNNH